MSSYTKAELQQATADAVLTADTLSAVYDGMYAAAIAGNSTYNSPSITPETVRDSIKSQLEAAEFLVTINQQDPQKLTISWAQ